MSGLTLVHWFFKFKFRIEKNGENSSFIGLLCRREVLHFHLEALRLEPE